MNRQLALIVGILFVACHATVSRTSQGPESAYAAATGNEASAAKEGFERLQALAAKNDSMAMNLLGQLHLSGTAVARNPVSAFRLFAEADSLGCAAASLNLGKCLFNGVGTARDLAQATAAFRRATASRDPHAWLMLGAALSEETPELDYGQDAIEAFHNAGLGGLDLGYEQLAIAAFRDDRPNPLVPR